MNHQIQHIFIKHASRGFASFLTRVLLCCILWRTDLFSQRIFLSHFCLDSFQAKWRVCMMPRPQYVQSASPSCNQESCKNTWSRSYPNWPSSKSGISSRTPRRLIHIIVQSIFHKVVPSNVFFFFLQLHLQTFPLIIFHSLNPSSHLSCFSHLPVHSAQRSGDN